MKLAAGNDAPMAWNQQKFKVLEGASPHLPR